MPLVFGIIFVGVMGFSENVLMGINDAGRITARSNQARMIRERATAQPLFIPVIQDDKYCRFRLTSICIIIFHKMICTVPLGAK
jgi:hypothetical protein